MNTLRRMAAEMTVTNRWIIGIGLALMAIGTLLRILA